MITKITKMVPKTFYIIDEIEFAANDVFEVLEKVIYDEGDEVGYYLDSCADKLVELGYLTKRYGMHQCIIYEDTEDRKAKALFEELIRM